LLRARETNETKWQRDSNSAEALVRETPVPTFTYFDWEIDMTSVHSKHGSGAKHTLYGAHRHEQLRGYVEQGTGHTAVVCAVAAVALAAAFGLAVMLPAGSAAPARLPTAGASEATEPSRLILNAMLVPALDGDALPLRWVDPRPILRCGPDTSVRVNHEPLVAGALVPDMPFELEWQANACHAFGTRDARFDGHVTLTVFREDWGFSATVEPGGLRVTSAENETTSIRSAAAWVPHCEESTSAATTAAAGPSLSCR
jgi:hypothetical protein